jgi:hypothetical protein
MWKGPLEAGGHAFQTQAAGFFSGLPVAPFAVAARQAVAALARVSPVVIKRRSSWDRGASTAVSDGRHEARSRKRPLLGTVAVSLSNP